MRVFCLFLVLYLGLSSPAHALQYQSDAFGFFIGEDEVRETWSGWTQSCSDGICETNWRTPTNLFFIEEYFGQKSLDAGVEVFMGVGLFQDENGNLLRAGSAELIVQDGEESAFAPIEYGLAHHVFKANEKAGQYIASIRATGLQSTSQYYRNVPDVASIDVYLGKNQYTGKQGGTLSIRTSALHDQFGNKAPIGLYLNGILKDEMGRYGYLPMVLQSDYAEAVIATNAMQGDYSFELALSNHEMADGQLKIHPEHLEKISFIRSEFSQSTHMLNLRLEGIQTNRKHLVQDAVPLLLEITDKDGKTQDKLLWTLEGKLQTRFAMNEMPFPAKIKISGVFGSLEAQIHAHEVTEVP